MNSRKHYVEWLLLLILSARGVFTDEPNQNITTDDADSHMDGIGEPAFSSSTISEKVPDAIGMPKNNNPHHHEKHKNPTDGTQTLPRRPLYEVVSQPCYSPGCGGYGPQDGFAGNRWQGGRNRYGPYPKYYEPRRRGGYGYREVYPQSGYGPNFGSPYPDYGYGHRGGYPQDKYERIGGYGRQPYDDYFLGFY